MTTKKRAIEPEDIAGYSLVTDVQISPDGAWLAYSLETLDAETDSSSSRIHLVETKGGEPSPLTAAGYTDRAPRWSPDSQSLAFLSDRSGTSQVHIIDIHGGEARKLTSLPNGGSIPAWSPDGKRLAFSAALDVEEPPEDANAKKRWENRPRVVRQAHYKSDGIGYLLESRTHVFVTDVETGETKQLTDGLTDESQVAWSADGSRLAFSRSRPGPLETTMFDIWTCSAEGGDERQVTRGIATAASPACSRDGKWIACLGSRSAADSMVYVWVVPSGGGEERALTEPLDREVASFTLGPSSPPVWSQDSKTLLTVLADRSDTMPARIDVDSGEVELIGPRDRQVITLTASDDLSAVSFLMHDFNDHQKVVVRDLAGDGGERILVEPNAEWEAQFEWHEAKRRTFEGPNGEIDGWVLVPEGAAKPVPLLVDVHGGPHSNTEYGFPYHPYRWMLAARGWAVLSLNASGSGSYGKEFMERVRGRWGELDFPEHMAAIDTLIDEGVVDPGRVAITGKSYGGFLTAWAIGHSDRFAAAVVSAPVANLESHFGTSDSGFYVDPYDMKGDPWDRAERYRELSPANYAHCVTTPTLLLHGEDDQRCPVGQSEELFARMMRAGKTKVEFVRFPGGDHHTLEQGPVSHRIDYVRRLVEWVDEHARGSPAAK